MASSLAGEDRRPALYGTLITFLVLNNVAVATRIYAHWRTYYRSGRTIFLDDIFLILSGVCVNVIIGNLLASTYYGLGLHSTVIIANDPFKPHKLSIVFEHVWITMVMASPTFTLIKLSLLFFYRRLFLVNQKWLRIAWWANLVYIMLWSVGATGFYIFQCWPVQWYWMQYYPRYNVAAPDGMKGQCNATSVEHVALPLIFGLASDVALLLLPITAILKLQISLPKKIGLAGIFSVGLLACLLELARILELELDTDDKSDPSYGVVVFLILSVAEEVTAIICGTLPVVIPQIYQAYQKFRSPQNLSSSNEDLTATKIGALPHHHHHHHQQNNRSINTRGFQKLGEPGAGQLSGIHGTQDLSSTLPGGGDDYGNDDGYGRSIPLNTVVAEGLPHVEEDPRDAVDARIVVKKEFHISRGADGELDPHAV